MRLNLGCGYDYRQGYVHVDLIHNPAIPPSEFKSGDATNLDWVCHDGEADEILALKVLQFIPYPVVGPTLAGWIKKLGAGGVLKLEVPDLSSITKAYLTGAITFEQTMVAIYGEVRTSGDPFHRSAFEHRALANLLHEFGMVVQRVSYNGMNVYVEATKA